MKEIALTKGMFAIVDDDMYGELSQHNWHAMNARGLYYAARTNRYGLHKENKSQTILMHRVIMNATISSVFVDHINGNTLDNRRENLRTATHAENMRNCKKSVANTSGTKGVNLYRNGKWRATIRLGNKGKHLGYFASYDDAVAAYRSAAIEYYGEFASFDR